MLRRIWQAWANRAKLIAPFYRHDPNVFVTHQLITRTTTPEPADLNLPLLQPYEGLAKLWHEHTRLRQPDYTSFLSGLRQLRGISLKSVLDLACGTGILAARLSEVADEVVGVDASEPMLAQARTHYAGLPGVEVKWGDFRDLGLDREFDVAVCAFNSLNYLHEIGELDRVFTSVSRHLRPGGVFVFDTNTCVGMRNLSGLQIYHETEGVRWAMYFTFNHHDRVEVATVVLPTGVELHRRIPIDPSDVIAAAHRTGLQVDEYFSHALIPGRWLSGGACFFVLSKRN